QIHDRGCPAQMEQHAVFFRVPEQHLIDVGFQRQPLTSGRQVAGAKIADDGDTGAFRDYRRHSQSEGGGKSTVRFMPDRMAGATDALDLLETQAGLVGDLTGRGGEGLAEQAVEQADLSYFKRPSRAGAQD